MDSVCSLFTNSSAIMNYIWLHNVHNEVSCFWYDQVKTTEKYLAYQYIWILHSWVIVNAFLQVKCGHNSWYVIHYNVHHHHILCQWSWLHGLARLHFSQKAKYLDYLCPRFLFWRISNCFSNWPRLFIPERHQEAFNPGYHAF